MLQQPQTNGLDNSEDINYKFKIVMLGDPNTGKSSLLQKYVFNSYNSESTQSTIGVDVVKKMLLVDSSVCQLSLWDTGGQDKYSSITENYFKKTLGFVLVYDLTDDISFDGLSYWTRKISERAVQNAVIILVGNKSDETDNRKITFQQAQDFCALNGVHRHLEASAKDGTNVAIIFQELAAECVRRIQNGKLPATDKENQSKIINLKQDRANDKIERPACC